MITEQNDVLNFHLALDIPVGDFKNPTFNESRLRADLIMEEAAETAANLTGQKVTYQIDGGSPVQMATPKNPGRGSMVETIDGMCDTLYVVYGTGASMGIDLAPFWDIVHASNMAKAGGPIREDGKRLKPEGWQPPDITGVFKTIYGHDPT